MVATIKFSQFAAANLSNTTNKVVGVSSLSGGTNFYIDDPLIWTTSTRPSSPTLFLLGANSSLGQYEYWNGASWVQFAAGGSGTVNLGAIGQVAYYAANGTAVSGESLSTLIDASIGSTQGDILYRNSSTWVILTPGMAHQLLQTGGSAANPSWTGALIVSSINFGGTSLANYQEGVFTPTFTSSGGGSCTYTSNTGNYTRIGNRVLFDIFIEITGTSLGSGELFISGLPLNAASFSAVTVNGATLNSGVGTQLGGYINPGDSNIALTSFSSGARTLLNNTSINASSQMIVSGQYYT